MRRFFVVGFKRRDDEDFVFDDDVFVWFDNMGFFDGEKIIFWIFDMESEEIFEEFEKLCFFSGVWYGDGVVINVLYREGSKLVFFKFYDIYLWKDGDEEKFFERVLFEVVDFDGKVIFFYGKREKKFMSEYDWFYFWDGEFKFVYEGLFNIGSVKFDGGKVYFMVFDVGRVNFYFWDGEVKLFIVGDYWIMGFDVYDGRIVFFIEIVMRLREFYFYDGEFK